MRVSLPYDLLRFSPHIAASVLSVHGWDPPPLNFFFHQGGRRGRPGVRAGSGRGAGGAAPKGRGRFWKIFFTKVAVGGSLRARPLRGAAPKGKASAVFEGQAVFFHKGSGGGPPARAHRLRRPRERRMQVLRGRRFFSLRQRLGAPCARGATPQQNWDCAVWTAAKTRHVTCANEVHTPQATHLLIYIYIL